VVQRENHQRSLAKTISWRILATVTTMGIVFIFTGRIVLSLGVGLVEVITKGFLYYLHERLWGKVSWGKPRHPLGDLPVNKELTPEHKEMIRRRLEELGYM